MTAATDNLLYSLEGPHEWGYRDPTDGTFLVDSAPFVAAAAFRDRERHLVKMLQACAAQFDEYAQHHLNKSPMDGEKALRNLSMSKRCQMTIDGLEPFTGVPVTFIHETGGVIRKIDLNIAEAVQVPERLLKATDSHPFQVRLHDLDEPGEPKVTHSTIVGGEHVVTLQAEPDKPARHSAYPNSAYGDQLDRMQRKPTDMPENLLDDPLDAAIRSLKSSLAAVRPEFPGLTVRKRELELVADAVKGWRCFHCNDFFSDRDAAAEHFGKFQDCEPICKVGAAKFREMEQQLASFQAEDDANSREFYQLGAKHAGEMRAHGDKEYAKGIADYKAELAEEYKPVLRETLQAIRPVVEQLLEQSYHHYGHVKDPSGAVGATQAAAHKFLEKKW